MNFKTSKDDSLIFRENEIRANKICTIAILIAAAVDLLDWSNGFSGFAYILEENAEIIFIALPAIVIAVIISCAVRFKTWWLKYVLLGALFLYNAFIMLASSGVLYIGFLFPILISCIYFSPRITRIFSALTLTKIVAVFILALVTGNVYEYFTYVVDYDASAGGTSTIDLFGLNIVRVVVIILVMTICLFIAKTGRILIEKQAQTALKDAGIDREISFAAAIQNGMLPERMAKRPEFDTTASISSAKVVCGDFYDFFMPDEKHAVFLIADVSGKGLPASLFMVNAKAYISAFLHSGLTADKVFEKANKALCVSNSQKLFVTAWLGIIDLETGVLTYANAGHNPPAISRNGGDYEFIESRVDFVLGRRRLTKFREQRLKLEPGDKLFIYTDGVTELMDKSGKQFSNERLLSVLNDGKDLVSSNRIANLELALRAFRGDAEQSDDITMLDFDYKQRYVSQNTDVLDVLCDAAGYREVMTYVREKLVAAGCKRAILTNVETVVSEIFANISMYAYPDSPTPGRVCVDMRIFERTATITFIDSGVHFNSLNAKVPDLDTHVKNHVKGKLGIFMVRKLADDIMYRYENNQNILTVVMEF
ncbi:MAG TPA: SpoIIE family protein phosphatase [Methanocorpusculum sp.]|nr:SpoIIE family protein phosphatase [Methanocorpusculum sp.]